MPKEEEVHLPDRDLSALWDAHCHLDVEKVSSQLHDLVKQQSQQAASCSSSASSEIRTFVSPNGLFNGKLAKVDFDSGKICCKIIDVLF